MRVDKDECWNMSNWFVKIEDKKVYTAKHIDFEFARLQKLIDRQSVWLLFDNTFIFLMILAFIAWHW